MHQGKTIFLLSEIKWGKEGYSVSFFDGPFLSFLFFLSFFFVFFVFFGFSRDQKIENQRKRKGKKGKKKGKESLSESYGSDQTNQ
jgi:hypothetical protein